METEQQPILTVTRWLPLLVSLVGSAKHLDATLNKLQISRFYTGLLLRKQSSPLTELLSEFGVRCLMAVIR